MKKLIKNIVLIILLLSLNSCIVKSINPFYTKKTIVNKDILIGEWTDGDKDKGKWKIMSFQKEILGEHKDKDISKWKKEDLEMYNNVKNKYFVEYIDNGEKSGFIATPFEINGELFIDFYPPSYEINGINSLLKYHLLETHSLAKLIIDGSNNISFKWMSQDNIEKLFKEKKIKIKHEKIGLKDLGEDNKILLTASSEKLQKFIKKYMNSDFDKKWGADLSFDLTRN
ncbi:MAG: hypothetical protein HRT66_13715 [Flavobacteriaceae bacterium]|nr:hypothetical protein [Flavobacteriaceae bacterium]